MNSLDQSNKPSGADSSFTSTAFKCQLCGRHFRREDHLRRHGLSHGHSKFVCQYPGCDMRFHRDDVRKRHEQVHRPDSLKQRRKPRRGIYPRGKMQKTMTDSFNLGTPSPEDRLFFQNEWRSINLSSENEDSRIMDYNHLMTAELLNTSSYSLNQLFSTDASFQNLGLSTTILSRDSQMIQHEGGSINLPTEYENSATMDYNNSVAAELLDSSNDSLNQLFSTDANFPNLELYTTSFSQSLPPVDVLQACVNLFQKSYSIRIPFIHQQTIVSPFLNLEIKYAMAAIGARGNPEYAPFSKIFFREACSYLHGTTSKNQLSRLQCQVLLIDFAVWTSDDTLHEWATQEVHKTAMVVKSLMGVDLYDGCKSEWTNWIDDEEHTRTIFAFYCLSISISIIYDYGNILSFHSIDLNLPEQEATWRACTEVEWYQEKQKQTGGDIHRAKFQSSIHALLTCDVSCEERYESASVFGRRVLLCAIAEAFDMAKRLPMNFLSEEGYHRASMSDFRLRTNFLEALKIWKNLWWAKPECLWDPTSSALAQLENMTFLNCLLIALSPSRTDELSNSREGITAAIEIFCSISKCGYLDVIRHAPRVLSPAGFYHVLECAKTVSGWLGSLAASEYDNCLSSDDGKLLYCVRQAVRRGLRETKTSFDPSMLDSLEYLQQRVLDLCSILFGHRECVEREGMDAKEIRQQSEWNC